MNENQLEPRPYGLCAGEFVVPDDFDQPLPEEILREFENSDIKQARGLDVVQPPTSSAPLGLA